jgi:hypothetical protein
MLKVVNGRVWLDPDRAPVIGLFGTLPLNSSGLPVEPEQFGYPVVGLPILGLDGSQLSSIDYEVPGGLAEPNCKPLKPVTRLLIENAIFTSNDTYSNQTGYGNTVFPSNTFQGGWNNTYQVGVGYANKPIIKQLRSLFYPADGRQDAYRQATFWDDFFWNAITVNASLSYGRQYQVKNGTPTIALTSKPFYSVSATYAVDLERLWIYATKPNSRPAESGYYYQADTQAFFVNPGQQPRFPDP